MGEVVQLCKIKKAEHMFLRDHPEDKRKHFSEPIPSVMELVGDKIDFETTIATTLGDFNDG